MESNKVYVGILEDDKNYSKTLCKIIDHQPDLILSFKCDRGDQLMPVLEDNFADILIMDIRLPDADGSVLVKKVKEVYPDMKCLMCTTFMDSDLIITSLRNGASGYILKTDTAENIIFAIKDVHQGAAYMSKHISLKIVEHFRNEEKRITKILEELSERENEVLSLLNQGMFYKEVAHYLDLRIDTVKKHASSIYKKLGVQNKTEALNIYNKK